MGKDIQEDERGPLLACVPIRSFGWGPRGPLRLLLMLPVLFSMFCHRKRLYTVFLALLDNLLGLTRPQYLRAWKPPRTLCCKIASLRLLLVVHFVVDTGAAVPPAFYSNCQIRVSAKLLKAFAVVLSF